MASPTLAVRVGILAAVVFGAVAFAALVLVGLFFVGLSSVPPQSLASGLLIAILLLVAVALVATLTSSSLVVLPIALTIVGVIAFLLGVPLAAIVVLLFFVLLALVRTVLGTPLMIPFWTLLVVLMLIPVLALFPGIIGLGGALMAIATLGMVALGLLVTDLIFVVHPLPLDLLFLGGLTSMPAVPLGSLPDLIEAVIILKGKQAAVNRALDGLTNVFTLDPRTYGAQLTKRF